MMQEHRRLACLEQRQHVRQKSGTVLVHIVEDEHIVIPGLVRFELRLRTFAVFDVLIADALYRPECIQKRLLLKRVSTSYEQNLQGLLCGLLPTCLSTRRFSTEHAG